MKVGKIKPSCQFSIKQHFHILNDNSAPKRHVCEHTHTQRHTTNISLFQISQTSKYFQEDGKDLVVFTLINKKKFIFRMNILVISNLKKQVLKMRVTLKTTHPHIPWFHLMVQNHLDIRQSSGLYANRSLLCTWYKSLC